jgi:hypothetical protein
VDALRLRTFVEGRCGDTPEREEAMTPAAIAIVSAAAVLLVVVAVRAVRNALDADEPWTPPLTDEQREANAERIWRSR